MAILTVNCIVGGTGVALGLRQVGLAEPAAILIGTAAGLLVLAVLAWYQIRLFTGLKAYIAAISSQSSS